MVAIKWLLRFSLLILFFPGLGEAATYWVSPTGNNASCATIAASGPTTTVAKTTIAAGITCMSSGDTLNIRTGTYSEFIDSAQDHITTAQSGTSYADGSATTIQAYQNEVVTLNNANGCLRVGTPASGAFQYFIFKGFVCDGVNSDTSNYPPAITIGGGNNGGRARFIKLDGIEVKNWKLTAIFLGGSETDDGNDLWATNMYVHDNGTIAGIILPGDPTPSYGHCFYVEGGPRTTIENTRCINQAGFGIHQYAGPATQTGNIYRNNWIENTGQADGRSAAGIVVLSGSGAQVYNNVLVNNQGGIGVTVDGNAVYSNTLYGTGVGHGEPGCCYPAINAQPATNTSFRNNLIIGSAIGFNSILIGGSGTTENNNLTTGLASDIFTDASNKIFTLKSGSAAIDQGSVLGFPYNADYAGTTRPQGTAYDIGAYEFTSGVSCPGGPRVLVASYGFDNAATDSSGNGLTASLNGLTYTTGKFGQGVSFSGIAAVTVADNNLLDICGAFTLEAQVKPTTTPTDFAAVIVKDYKYWLYSAAHTDYCANNGIIGGYTQSSDVWACFATPLTPNVFSHLAITYDPSLGSANIKLWVNASNVASANGTATIDPSTGLLYIGGSPFGEYFTGVIDEVRIYSGSSTGAELLADSVTPIGVPTAPTGFKLK